MSSLLSQEINEFGFARYSQLLDKEQIINLRKTLSELNIFPTARQSKAQNYGVRNLLNQSPEIRKLAESEKIKALVKEVLGLNSKPVRAIFFDKTAEVNWKVPWHQDLTIAVKEKRETENFTAWTLKAGIQHVQPPISILEKMLTVRIHLDDADETNGALKVISKSHKLGRLSADEIQILRKSNKPEICCVESGEAFLMRPLLVHSSSAGTNPTHRRVIHIEFSAENLPNNLEWYGS